MGRRSNVRRHTKQSTHGIRTHDDKCKHKRTNTESGMVPTGLIPIWDRTPPLTPLPIPIDPAAASMAASFFTHDDDDASHPFLGLESASAVDGVWTDADHVWLSGLTPHAAALPSIDEAHHHSQGHRRTTTTRTEEVAQEDNPVIHPCQSIPQNNWLDRGSTSSRIESPPAAIAGDAWIDPKYTSHTSHNTTMMDTHTHIDIAPSSSFRHSLLSPSLPSSTAPSASPLDADVDSSSLKSNAASDSEAAAPPPSAPAAAPSSKRVKAVQACVACRRMKSACDHARPCDRCVRAGRPCIDQAGVETPDQRRPKRSVEATTTEEATSTSHASNTEPPQPVAPAAAGINSASSQFDGLSTADLDQLSSDLSSRCCLAVAMQMDFRDKILRTHAQVIAMKPLLSTLVEWHTQVTLLCLEASDLMSPADFETFLIGGLTEEELDSPNWLSSPLAPWRHVSTRPLHFTFQPNTLALESHLAGVGAPHGAAATSHEDASDPEFRLEWLPDTHAAFQHWRNALEARLRYEQQRQEARDRVLPGTYQTDAQTTAAGAHSASSEDNVGGIIDRFLTLGISRALSVPPPPPTHHDRVYSVHALWCPLGGPAENVARERERDAAKVKRTSSMQHVRSREIDDPYATPSSAAECCCKNSLPLPMRVTVNRSFERIFGWRRIDVELGVQREGLKWNRRWSPPSQWPLTHRALLMRFEPAIGHLLGPAASAADARRQLEAEAFTEEPHICFTQTGGSVMAASRTIRVIKSDGVREKSGVILSWKMQV